MMTLEMFEKCLNKDGVTFKELDIDVQHNLRNHSDYVEYYSNYEGKWCKCMPLFYSNEKYRISETSKSIVVDIDKYLELIDRCKNTKCEIFKNLDDEVKCIMQECFHKYGNGAFDVIRIDTGEWDDCGIVIMYIKTSVLTNLGRIFRINDLYIEKLREDYISKSSIKPIHIESPVFIDSFGSYCCTIPQVDDNNIRSKYDIFGNLRDAKRSKFFVEYRYDDVTKKPTYVIFDLTK